MDALVAEAAQVLAACAGPLLLGLLVVGSAVGVFQAATQVNDPALGGAIAERLAAFLASSLSHLAP